MGGPRLNRRAGPLLLILFSGLVVSVFIGIVTGRYPNPGILPFGIFRTDPLALIIVTQLRLPRVITALALGATLGVAGSVLQMLFSNPLVEPGLIGVSQGSAFGAALSIVIFSPALWIVQLFASVFGFIGLLCSYTVARRLRFGGRILRLVLSGIAVSAFFSAGVGLIKFVADPLSQLPAITFWLLGGLSSVTWRALLQIAPVVIVSLVVIYVRRWRLNLLSLDDRVSFSLGTAPERERMILLVAATLATASVISVAGIIGWVGLLVPHIARRLVGSDGRGLVPAAALLGAIFTVLSDTLARTVIAGEIPLGIVTSLLGASGFVALLATSNIRVER